MLREIQQARAAAEEQAPTVEGEAAPYEIGQLLRITNRLRNEFRTTGKVIRVGELLVTICNVATKRKYTRAWFNLEPVRYGAYLRFAVLHQGDRVHIFASPPPIKVSLTLLWDNGHEASLTIRQYFISDTNDQLPK